MTDAARTAAIVLAAGAGSRFGGGKLLAELGGRPLLDRVLALTGECGLARTLVVTGPDAPGIEALAAAHGAFVVLNPRPERGLSSSVRTGLDILARDPPTNLDAALVLLGDQPLTSPATVRALLAAEAPAGRSIVVPRYLGGGGANPVLLLRAAWPLAAQLEGDRGFGPLIGGRPDLVHEVELPGDNPDMDTTADLARLVEDAWAERVEANRDQVDRIREVPDGDFYAPVRSLFRADPDRTDDPVLGLLLEHVQPADRWLDVGAGAGRFALPIARALAASDGQVIALDPSPSMLASLREIAEAHGIGNVQTVEERWPPADGARLAEHRADVVLIAHVGYDIAPIGPFLDALERVAERSCLAVLMEQVPASAADPFWPLVHGEDRQPLPALPEFLELLHARGRPAQVVRVPNDGRLFDSRAALGGFVRRQLWIDPAGSKEARFQAALEQLAIETDGGWAIAGRGPNPIGVVSW